MKEFEIEIEMLKSQLADARTSASNTEAEIKRLREEEEEKEKLRAADAKGYEAGIKRAALEYAQIAHKMVNDELEVRLPDFYRLGYDAGAEAMAGVMVIQPESGFLKQLPEPVIPDLELLYTEEECAPLPPEEDEDEEMAEASEVEKPAKGEKEDRATEAEGQKEVAATENP